MTVVTGTITDTAGQPITGTMWVKTTQFRTDGTTMLAPQDTPHPIVDGQIAADLAPGAARIGIQSGRKPPHYVHVTVPEHGSVTLASLIGDL